MDDAPLPTTLTPKEEISESFEIKQDKNNYKLDIKIINKDIILNLKDQKEVFIEYEHKFALDELKQLHRVFLPLNSCQEFLDYLKVLIKNNKLSIKGKAENKIFIELNVEYLFKQNIIIINLFQKKINFELIAQDLYKKYSSLTENFKNLELNYKNILQEDKNIKEENKNMKNEIEKLKNENKENKNQKEKIINLEKDNNLFIDNQLIDNINKRFEELETKYELIKKENIEYKKQIEQIEQIIVNLNKRIELITKENQRNLNQESTNVFQVENNENILKENDEMLTKSMPNDIISFETMNKDFFNQIGDSIINKKNEKKVDNKNPKAIKKEIKEDIIVFKGNNLFELLENKLIKIFTEKGSDIKKHDMNDLKKICSALLISKVEPNERINEFIKNNFNNFQNELDENNKTNLAMKKVKVFDGLQNLSLLL